MDFPIELLINAIIAGVLLGGFYIAVTVGVSISFGMLDIVNIAHPAFIILGSYLAYIINSSFGIDPVVVGLILTFGVDYRYAEAAYIGPALHFSFIDLPYRMLVPCVVSLLLFAALQLYLMRTFI